MIKNKVQSTNQVVSTRFKMYKAGKVWLFSSLAVAAFYTGFGSQITTAHADAQSVTETQIVTPSSAAPTSGAAAVALTPASSTATVGATSANVTSSTPTVKAFSAASSPASVAPAQTTSTATAATSAVPTAAQLTTNIKDNVTVPASYLADAQYPGPFTAGVNQQIPFNAFGGDGMLTRLLLNSSDGAPWSDNGVAKNSALLPIETSSDQYTYEVDLNGNTTGKTNQALLDQLKVNGQMTYNATVKIFAKDNLATPAATKSVAVNLTTLTDNISSTIDVPASYLANAQYPDPFTAGVNQQIPFNAFGGDGMLTRLLLNSSDGAPWSDNGVAKNAALLPISANADEFIYEVDLNGNTVGKTGQSLLNQLKDNGKTTYAATVKVFAKGDTSTPVATKSVTINLNGLTDHIKSMIDVPASYLSAANYPGPFTAGVNQVIPFSAFGGDGMLTRLLLDSAAGAPWSNNGSDKYAALLPIGMNADEFFYEVDLNGNTTGKSGQALLDQLKANGTMTYNAIVKIYGSKNGQADLTNVLGTKTIQITLNGASTVPSDSQAGSSADKTGTTATNGTGSVATSGNPSNSQATKMQSQSSTQSSSNMAQSMSTNKMSMMEAAKAGTMAHAKMDAQQKSAAKHSMRQLPQTSADQMTGWAAIEVAILASLAGLAGVLGLRKRQ